MTTKQQQNAAMLDDVEAKSSYNPHISHAHRDSKWFSVLRDFSKFSNWTW
jgi:hypothetical protein